MTDHRTRQWRLASRPTGEPTDENFKRVTVDRPEPGEVVASNHGDFDPGDVATGNLLWADHAVAEAAATTDPRHLIFS